jgi:hypothetical protein
MTCFGGLLGSLIVVILFTDSKEEVLLEGVVGIFFLSVLSVFLSVLFGRIRIIAYFCHAKHNM